MSLEAISQRPSSSSSKEHVYSSEREASSRLAARLERSEYKRSRGRQRIHNHGSSGRSRRRDYHRDLYEENVTMHVARTSRQDRRENDPMKEDPFYSRRQDAGQYYGSSDHKRIRNTARPQSWFGAPLAERNFGERPRSIHEISLDRGDEGRAFPFGNDPSKKPRYRKKITRQDRNQAGAKKGRQVELSRSLSSSFSSQVGSSADERERHHGIYSAYDMTGRSPYGSFVLRRCSQSSLSSSSASWQHSSTSLSHQAGRAQWGSGSLGSSSPDKPPGQHETVQKAVFIKRPPRIPEVVSSANATFVATMPTQHSSSYRVRVKAVPHSSRNRRVQAQATPYSSGHHVTKSVPSRPYGHDAMDSSVSDIPIIQSLSQVSLASLPSSRSHRIHEDEQQNVCPSVKDLAKRFSGNSEFSSEAFDGFYENDYRDTRRVKAQTWPKFAFRHSGETIDDEVFDVAPPKPPYPQTSDEDFTLAQTGSQSNLKRSEPEASERGYPLSANGQVRANAAAQNSNELAAHRLSLQELIRLHEDQIAKHAKSALATAHAQIYLKRPEVKAWNAQSPQRSPPEFKKEGKWYYAKEGPGSGGTPQGSSSQFGTVNRVAESRAQLLAHYELMELKTDKAAPIKVIEVTEKGASEKPRECPPVKPKRHRTIGVVGFRQQIDRVSENKPKRHTAIGIVSVKAVATTTRQLAKEEPVVVGQAGYTVHAAVEKSTDSLDSSEKEHHSDAAQEMQLEEKDRRIVKRTCKEYEFEADPLAPANFQDRSLVEEEMVVRAEASAQFVRPDEVAQVSPRFEHDQEEESARPAEDTKKTEVGTRVVVASPEKSTTSFEVVDSKTSNMHGYRTDGRTWSVPLSSRAYSYAKPYATVSKAVPVAQVSPVSPTSEHTLRTSLTKESLTDSSPYSRSQSAREMYETRLALWNLYPPEQQMRSASTASGAHRQQTADTERSRSTSVNVSVLSEQAKVHEAETKDEPRLTSSRKDMEEHYLSRIEKLKDSNKELIAKYEAEKRELRQKYEEQRKVANAYQKLEDRYRRRVHELQEALAGCTCQRSFVRQNKVSQSLSVRSDKEGDRSTTASSTKGLKIVSDSEDWLSEQSNANSASKKNSTASRNTLITSSSDMVGTAWDELYDLLQGTGEIDFENGTHV